MMLPIRWALFGLTYGHLKLTRDWGKRSWFLELPDIDTITKIGRPESGFQLSGEIIWWAEGKDAEGEWWPQDRIPDVTKWGGKYVAEPFEARVFPLWHKKRGLSYEIEFGQGSTYQLFTNRKGRVVRL